MVQGNHAKIADNHRDVPTATGTVIVITWAWAKKAWAPSHAVNGCLKGSRFSRPIDEKFSVNHFDTGHPSTSNCIKDVCRWRWVISWGFNRYSYIYIYVCIATYNHTPAMNTYNHDIMVTLVTQNHGSIWNSKYHEWKRVFWPRVI